MNRKLRLDPVMSLLLRVFAALAAITTMNVSGAVSGESSPLVALATIDPSITQDIRYATARNFTGGPVLGYEAGVCLLRPAAARALAEVQAELKKRTPPLALKVYDCYRPERAVRAFVEWAKRDPEARSAEYHPRLSKTNLFSKGYIARSSTHSRGIAVDLTLVEPSAAEPKQDRVTGASCIEPGNAGAPDGIDMGTTFDCFDAKSSSGASGLTGEQARMRRTLRDVMASHGFRPYAGEWWHFSYPAADNGRAFDVPVR